MYSMDADGNLISSGWNYDQPEGGLYMNGRLNTAHPYFWPQMWYWTHSGDVPDAQTAKAQMMAEPNLIGFGLRNLGLTPDQVASAAQGTELERAVAPMTARLQNIYDQQAWWDSQSGDMDFGSALKDAGLMIAPALLAGPLAGTFGGGLTGALAAGATVGGGTAALTGGDILESALRGGAMGGLGFGAGELWDAAAGALGEGADAAASAGSSANATSADGGAFDMDGSAVRPGSIETVFDGGGLGMQSGWQEAIDARAVDPLPLRSDGYANAGAGLSPSLGIDASSFAGPSGAPSMDPAPSAPFEEARSWSGDGALPAPVPDTGAALAPQDSGPALSADDIWQQAVDARATDPLPLRSSGYENAGVGLFGNDMSSLFTGAAGGAAAGAVKEAFSDPDGAASGTTGNPGGQISVGGGISADGGNEMDNGFDLELDDLEFGDVGDYTGELSPNLTDSTIFPDDSVTTAPDGALSDDAVWPDDSAGSDPAPDAMAKLKQWYDSLPAPMRAAAAKLLKPIFGGGKTSAGAEGGAGSDALDALLKLGLPAAVLAGLFEKNQSPLVGPMKQAAEAAYAKAGQFGALEGPGITPSQQQAIDKAKGADGAWKPYFDKAGALTDTATGGITAPNIQKYMNPELEGALAPAIRDIQRAAEQRRQRLRAQVSASGNDFRTPGANRFNVEDNLLDESMFQEIGDLSGKMRMQAWGDASALAGKDLDRSMTGGTQYANLGKAAGALAGNDFDLLNKAGALERTPYEDTRSNLGDTTKLYTGVVHGTAPALSATTPDSMLTKGVGAIGALKTAKDIGIY